MSDATFSPPRKKLNILWWMGGFILLLLGLFLFQLFGPNPAIVISRQTTYITDSLDSDGLPDYEQHLLRIYRDGATPENNAAVLLWQALGAADINPQDQAAVAAEIGLQHIPTKSEVLEPPYSEKQRKKIAAWLHQQGKLRFADHVPDDEAIAQVLAMQPWPLKPEADQLLEVVDNVIDQAMSRPWTSSEFPPLGEWLAENNKSLDLIVQASRRPKYYFPSAKLLNGQHDALVGMLLDQVQTSSNAGRALLARAMWHLGENKPLEAWQDLLAIHRLSRLLTQGHTLVEQFVAVAIDSIACEGTVTLLNDRKLTIEQAQTIERDLCALPTFAVMAKTIDHGERIIALDIVLLASRDASGIFSSSGMDEHTLIDLTINVVSVDWNLVLRETNQWYDRLVAAASLPDRPARAGAIAQVESDLRLLDADVKTPAALLRSSLSRCRRSKFVSAMVLNLLMPTLSAASAAEDRANTALELARLSAALAVFRAKQRKYPERLTELVPDVLQKLPVDLYHSKPFIYQRIGEGYLLYSAGDNEVDDGGSHEGWGISKGQSLDELDDSNPQKTQSQIPTGADDHSIRVPRPPVAPPKFVPVNDSP